MIAKELCTKSDFKLHVIPTHSKEPLLNCTELAEYLSVSTHAVRKWRLEGRIPCYKLGRAVRFRAAEVVNSLKGERK